jgi:2-oxo-3-hexenedioate decarboxylase
MSIAEDDSDTIAAGTLAASDAARSIQPITDSRPGFDLPAAYRVSAEVVRRRMARGEKPIGWKIGFTNRTIWDEYDVHAPIWGPVYDTTVSFVPADAMAQCALAPLVEPRIEPEIVLRLGKPPDPTMNEAGIMECIDGVAHGFEIVQSLFPAWRFRAADTVAAFALHGRLFVGPFTEIRDGTARKEWRRRLTDFEIVLSRDRAFVDRGHGTNVLDGPVHALLHFVRGLAEISGERLSPGAIVTTGTVTRAFPVHPGETWSTELIGLPLPGCSLRLT